MITRGPTIIDSWVGAGMISYLLNSSSTSFFFKSWSGILSTWEVLWPKRLGSQCHVYSNLSDGWQYSLSETYHEVHICQWQVCAWSCVKKEPEKFQTYVSGVHLISTVIEKDVCIRWQTTILHCTGKVEGAGLLGCNLNGLQKTHSYYFVRTCKFWT